MSKGCFFGITDIVASMINIDKEDELDNWIVYKDKLLAISTVET